MSIVTHFIEVEMIYTSKKAHSIQVKIYSEMIAIFNYLWSRVTGLIAQN